MYFAEFERECLWLRHTTERVLLDKAGAFLDWSVGYLSLSLG